MPKILVLNAGSSSLKCALYQEPGTQLLWEAHSDGSGGSPMDALPELLQSIEHAGEIDAVGHRVVHGGSGFRHPTLLTPAVRAAIEQLSEFAPVHNPVALAGMKGIDRILGTTVPQIAVFDTAFHASLPPANFVYPGPYEWLRDTFAHAQSILSGPRGEAQVDKPHVMTAVIGVRGGVGASTLATSLAWLLGEKAHRSTALLDLDVHFGTGALALDLEPGRGLTDAIENPSRIDGLFIERAMVRANERLSVLSAEAPINSPLITDGTAFFQLQEEMRNAFESTVIDLPRQMLIQYPHMVHDAHVAVVVAELTLAATRDTIRILAWLKSNAPQTKVIVVANGVPSGGALEISKKDFEQSIERSIDIVFPEDGKLAAQAAKLGKPMAEVATGKMAAPFAQLSNMVLSHASEDGAAAETKAAGKAGAAKGSMMNNLKSMLAKKAA